MTLLGVDCVDIQRLFLAAEICQQDFEFADVKLLTSLHTVEHESIVSIEPITSVEAYSRFMIHDLDKYIGTSHVLIIQYDGFILNPEAWTDEFLNYDYIGAPWLVKDWSVNDFHFPPQLLGERVVGNGGFSLRSKKLTAKLAEMSVRGRITKYHPEDVVIAVHNRRVLEGEGIVFAPVPLAQKFSFEAEDDSNRKWNGQLGFHGLRWTDISKWLEKHPEYPIDNAEAIRKSNRV